MIAEINTIINIIMSVGDIVGYTVLCYTLVDGVFMLWDKLR